LLGLVLAAWSLLFIAWLTLQWGILPHIQQWREPIEARVSAALGVPVRIGSIVVRTGGWIPSIELRDVILLDSAQRAALRLPRVVAAVSPQSLLSLQLRFEQLYIDGPEIEVRRNALGRISIGGLGFDGRGGDDRGAIDWFFNQHEFVIRGGSVRWIDELRQAQPLALTDVQLVVRNGLRDHAMRLDATPPVAWGERFTLVGRFSQPLLAHRGDWRRWSGAVFASLPRADVSELRRRVDLPFELSEGDGALRAWFEIDEGRPQAATVDVALRAVSMRLDPSVEALTVEQVQGRLGAQRHGDATTLTLQHFGFVTGDGVRWPEGDISLAWRQQDGQPTSGGEFKAQRIDLGAMAQVASRIPFGVAVGKLLVDLDPKGVASGLAARWDGPLDAPLHYRAQGVLTGLSLAPHAAQEPGAVGRPGLRNASLKLDASETGGTAQIAITDGAIELPGIYDEPVLPLDRLDTVLQWKIEAVPGAAEPRVTAQLKDAHFANPDAQGSLNATWRTGAGSGVGRDGRYPGQLRLDTQFSHAEARRVARYLPLGIPRDVRGYVENAVRSGDVTAATFHVDGKLWDFPFASPQTRKEGEFRFAAQLADVDFAYVPDMPAEGNRAAYISPWPAMSHLNAELVIDRSTLEIRNARAVLGGVEWSHLQAGIRDLDNAVVTVDAAGRGPLDDMLQFLAVSPVGAALDQALARATASGPADLKLGLTIPLQHTDATQVKGSLVLAGNDLRFAPGTPPLTGARGRIDFGDHGLSVAGASAQVLGGPAAFQGGSQADGSLRFTGRGTATAEGLRHGFDVGDLAAAGLLNGQAAYRFSLGFVHGKAEVALTSNLVGMALNLPAPLTKAADAPLALRYETTLAADSLVPGHSPHDSVRFELGPLLQAVYQRDLSGDVPRVQRGGIGVMEAVPLPAAGVAANIDLPSLDLDAWQKLLGGAAGGGSADAMPANDYVPDTIALRVGTLSTGSRRLQKLVAGISQSDGVWRANLDAEQLDGYLEYRPPRGGASVGGVYARLSRLSLPKGEADGVETLLDQPPDSIPGLDIVVDDLELRGRHLGRLDLEAANHQIGEGRDAIREWQLARFNLSTPEADFLATGSWGAAGGSAASQRRSVMDFSLSLSDSGALLDRLGTPKAVRGGKGKLSGQVSWQGSPMAIDYPSLAGQIHVAIDSGQFLKVDPGAARLLGVLSLQSLPRRLSFDFRDLFQQGFAFDNIDGDVKIAQGEAQTNNLRMRGAQAVVLMEGSADIARETQDLHVWVVPDVNAGAASLAYAVINPAIGLGTFLAQVVLRKQLAQAGTREFHVHGPWVDPKVDAVERKFSDDVPSFDAPASAPSPTR
jgi:uncharacterized protein (TIGR02099 family)